LPTPQPQCSISKALAEDFKEVHVAGGFLFFSFFFLLLNSWRISRMCLRAMSSKPSVAFETDGVFSSSNNQVISIWQAEDNFHSSFMRLPVWNTRTRIDFLVKTEPFSVWISENGDEMKLVGSEACNIFGIIC
jgi:hypothetical protein